ncbi:M28 family peptidase [Permianibacter sp. IMCC34836]|uniref:M28 family peptidase n=1 Tax=Permianibacter fluminis TaxID=2738515 RepID=UPI001552DA37|nr:M28 family peptidase [Permianibacter fluminis]NQD39064.1 M28 family peptidase [Permianibacter fluminis]
MKRFLITLALFAASTTAVRAQAPASDLAASQRWLSTLAADAAAGRRTGSPEQQRIGDWLAEEFRALGLKPLAANGSYFQPFTITGKDGSTFAGRNVLAVLPGTQPAASAEYILLSAHYDHIGTDSKAVGDDHVFNGADDNASGVTTMLGIARQLQQQLARGGARPTRSIVFAAWDGEEFGLKGSAHFVQQPLLPLARIVTNLNFEMVGVTEGKHQRNLWMTGWQHSELFDTLKPLLAQKGWSLEADPYPDWHLFLRSDNAAFASVKNIGSEQAPHWLGIPAHSLSVWRGQEHYHALNDQIDLIDLDNLTELSNVMTDVVTVLARPQSKIEWKVAKDNPFSRLPENESAPMTGSP